MHGLWDALAVPQTVSRADVLHRGPLEVGGVGSSDFQLVKFYPVSLTFLEEGSGN